MQNQPTQVKINDSIICQGICVRTNNENEMNPSTAKIGELWDNFYQNVMPTVADSPQLYGLYYNYASDVNGDFDVMAAVSNALANTDNLTLTSTTIPAGNYLVFTQQGKMPQAVITAWQQVWAYFTNANCQHTRKYSVDFEKYVAEDIVEVYIAVD